MGKEELAIYQAHKKRISFIEDVVGERALEKIRASERNQGIALVYYLNWELAGEQIGEIYPNPSGKALTRARISQISREFLKQSWEHASPQLQACYPLEDLLTKRPTALGEITSRVKIVVEKGAVTPTEIKAIGVSGSQLAVARRTLRDRDINVPCLHNPYSNFAETVEGEDNDQNLQKILDSYSDYSLMSYLQRYKEDPEKTLITLASILKKAGFNSFTRSNLFAEKLKKNGIPIRPIVRIHCIPRNGKEYQQVSYIVLRKHKQRITRALRDDPDLQKFKKIPVEVSENIPAYL